MTVIPAAAMRNPLDEPGPEPKNIVSSGHLLEEIASIVCGRVANEDAATMNRTDTQDVTAEILARLIANTYKKVDLLGWFHVHHKDADKLSQVMSSGIKLAYHRAQMIRDKHLLQKRLIPKILLTGVPPGSEALFFYQYGNNIFDISDILILITHMFLLAVFCGGIKMSYSDLFISKQLRDHYGEVIPAQGKAFCAAVDEYVDEVRQQFQAQNAAIESPEVPAPPQ